MPMPRAPVRLDSLQSHNQSNEANRSGDMEVYTYELDCSIGPSGLVLNSKLSPYRSRSSIFFRRLCDELALEGDLVPRAYSRKLLARSPVDI